MNKLERIARDLAAVLSEAGEADWQRYVPLAGEVSRRLDRQFPAIMDQQADTRIAVQCLGRTPMPCPQRQARRRLSASTWERRTPRWRSMEEPTDR